MQTVKGFNEMKSSGGDAPSVPEIDDYLSKHLKHEDKAHAEESRAIRALLNVDGDKWPSKMRVMRTLDLAGGEYRRKIEFLMSEDGGGFSKGEMIKFLETPGFASRLLDDDLYLSFDKLQADRYVESRDDLVRLLSTPVLAGAVRKDAFFPAITKLVEEGYASADDLVQLLSTPSFAYAVQKDGFFESIERLLKEGYATVGDLVQLLSTRSFANAIQKDGFFESIERLLKEGYATVDTLVQLLSTPHFAYAVQKDGFFPAVKKLLEEGHVTIAVLQKAISRDKFANLIQKDGFFSALATLEQNHGFTKKSEALSRLFLQSQSFALVMNLRSEFFSRIRFLEELGFSPMQVANCLDTKLKVVFKRLTEPENSSGKHEARHASNLKWLVTSIADGGPGLNPQDLQQMFCSSTKIQKEKLAKVEALELPIFRNIVWLAIAMHRQYRHGSSIIAGQSRHRSSVVAAYRHLAIEFADCVGKTYSLSFSGQKLGLSLRSVVVDKVLDKSLTAVGKGDRIVAVGNAVITAAAGAETIARIIQHAERPLKITFCKN